MTPVPQPIFPLADSRGVVAPVWYRYLAGLSASVARETVVALTASPQTYQANDRGFLMVSGASSVTWSRDGSTFHPAGALVPMVPGDQAVITYSGAPSIVFVPF